MPVSYSRSALDANGGAGNPYLNRKVSGTNPNLLWRFRAVDNDWSMVFSRLGPALDANGGTGNPYMNSNIDSGNQNLHWKVLDLGPLVAILPRVWPGAALDANGAKAPPQLPYINRSATKNKKLVANDNFLWKKVFHGGGYYLLEPKLQSPTFSQLTLPYSKKFKDSYRLDAGGIFHIPTPLYRHAITNLTCTTSGQIEGVSRFDNEEAVNGWTHGVSAIVWNLDGDPMTITSAHPYSTTKNKWQYEYFWPMDPFYLRDGLRWRFKVSDPKTIAVISFYHVSLPVL